VCANQRIIISRDRLSVEIAQPGTVYTGTRFDWSGFVTQVTLDGAHTFCQPESLMPGKGTGGIGLCGEFGNELAVGYDEAQPGEPFPKLGIGLLARPDEASYNFFRPHQIVERFPIRVEAGESEARFVVEPLECRGYAARLRKVLRVKGNTLSIKSTLENTGARRLVTHEYNHNFIGIDDQPVGPAYTLTFPQEVHREPPPPQFYRMAPPALRWLPKPLLRWLIGRLMRRMGGAMTLRGDEITWPEMPQRAFFTRLRGFQPRADPQWTLAHHPSGLQVSETDDFPPARLVVWGEAHVACAEVYTDLDVQPGASHSWKRTYTFSQENSP